MTDEYFASLARQLAERAARATISDRTPSHAALREFLRTKFEQPPGNDGSFLGQPVFEALFEYETQEKTIEELELLHPRLIQMLDNPPGEHAAKRFPKELYPYKHQVASWKSLKVEPARSAIISTGTASGKTECFLIPILDDLVREYEQTQRPLVGVRALFLYPLNALINSQRERLAAWTAGMQGDIRFCLYNGATPTQVTSATEQASPEEILCRNTLRASPPPILVTNATMLEYMLVRNADIPIIDKSRGKLRWIVLDEAHTYLGSNAAEVSLLMRRVMEAFGANPQDVHFVATSATIGGEGAEKELREYLADLAGISTDQVDVIGGCRVTPELKEKIKDDQLVPTIDELKKIPEYADRRTRLVSVPEIRNLRYELTAKALTAQQIGERLGTDEDIGKTLALLDYCSEKPEQGSGQKPLLPIRGHYFMRTQPGVWSCWNNKCVGKSASLADESWPFGSIYFNQRERCQHCDSLVFEVLICKDCGEVYLSAEEDDEQRLFATSWMQDSIQDEFDIVLDEEEDDEDGEETTIQSSRQLICSHPGNDFTGAMCHYHRLTGEIGTKSVETLPIRLASHHDVRDRLRCVTCGETDSASRYQFQSIRVGASFYLGVAIPTFLAHAPANSDQKSKKPRDGRQMITFTDSRQGTARFASRMEIEAERNYVRSFIYHKLWSKATTSSQEEVEDLRKTVEQLRNASGLEKLTLEKSEELAEKEENLDNPTASISWDELVVDLQKQDPIQIYISDATRLRYSEALTEPHLIARMLLFREFARRPKSGVSLETLGLASIRFPQIDSISPPQEWVSRGKTKATWQAYLKLCIDYFIRGAYCSDIPDNLRRWMGMRFRPKWLLEPDAEVAPRGSKRWPTIRTSNRLDQRLIEMLRLALRLKGDNSDQLLIDLLLRQAWRDLLQSGIFNSSESGYQLIFEKSEIHLLTKGYRCPVTQRVLDNVLCGISPYQNERTYKIFGATKNVEMPQVPFPFCRNREDGQPVPQHEIDTWLKEDPRVRNARQLGVWTEFSDRIAEFYYYFETAEHSGQLSKSRLQELEKRFRNGKTNVLSCSTTMEMGIDIGGLTSVAMNNAPPGPSNWLQRAGRAGRRDIARASTLTLCPNQPHGQFVFNHTLWPFETPIHVPKVELNSKKIVQRHIQAFLLGRFLDATNTDNAIRLTNVWMFHSEDKSLTTCNRFMNWLEGDAEIEQNVIQGISQIVRRSVLEPESLRSILDRTVGSIKSVSNQWMEQREALVRELNLVGGVPDKKKIDNPEQRALMFQLQRLEGEYLLKELASGGFLPAHGFPLNVLPFVNTSVEQIRAEEEQREENRDDNLFQKRSYPSRELAMAMREYAPGNSVMIDGLSYLSSGLTLHWQVPPSDQEFREAQAILGYWWCNQCGASQSSSLRPENCQSCDHTPMSGQSYIKPSGFAVDIRKGSPNSNADESIYVPPAEPRLACQGDWVSMPNPELGSFRYDSQGKIFHHSRGASGFGYAICLRCGRAASEKGLANAGVELPSAFVGQHSRLRSGKKSDNSHLCPGSGGEYTIKRNLWLGGEETTDVFQLRLRHPNKHMSVVPEDAAVSIAVALRTALSRTLGIEEREIGWAVQNNRQAGIGYRDIYLYDTADGGAGYVAASANNIEGILEDARKILSCQCDKACHRCLLDFTTQGYADLFNRHAALDWLDADFFQFLQVPKQFCSFGEMTLYESRSITESIRLEMQSSGLKEITVCLHGNAELWDLDSWTLWRHLAKISTADTRIPIKIVLPQSVKQNLPWPILHSLVSKASGREIQVEVIPDQSSKINDCLIAATVSSAAQSMIWGVFDEKSLVPGSEWGAGSPDWPSIKSKSVLCDLNGEEITLSAIDAERPEGCTQLLVTSQLDGTIKGVGNRFWSLLQETSPWLKKCMDSGAPCEIIYTDRYIRTPLHTRVLLEILNYFTGQANTTPITLQVQTGAASSNYPANLLHQNWQRDNDQKQVIQALLKNQFNLTVSIHSYNSQLRHARFLHLSWSDGRRVDIHLDQGIGFFRTSQSVQHDFSRSAIKQAEKIRIAKFTVQHTGADMPVYIVRSQNEK